MIHRHLIPRNVTATVEAFVLSRRPSSMIATSEAIRTVRYLLPHCQESDAELAELVARCAIDQGRDVAFDRTEVKELLAVA